MYPRNMDFIRLCFGTVLCFAASFFAVAVHPRPRRFVPASAANSTMSTVIANAQSVYCSNNFGVDSGSNGKGIPTLPSPLPGAQMALVGGSNESATTPAYFSGRFPTLANVARITPLNDSQMQEVFQHKGGTYLPEYMAATQKEAEQNFPDLLLMTAPVKISGSNTNLTVYDNYIAQQTIVDDLKRLIQRGSSADLLSTVTKQPPLDNLPTLFKAITKTSLSSTTSPKPNSGQYTTPVPDTTAKPATLSNTGDRPAALMANGPYDSSISDPSKPWKSTSKDPNIAREGSNFAGLETDWNSVWNEVNTTVHPEALKGIELVNRRRKRQSDGSISKEQYCHLKGSKTQDGYLHTCSTCAVITTLPDNYFPRFINEAVCKTGDSGCFVINGLAHGECRQRTITLNIMRKKPNRCLLMNHNGERTLIDDWELYPHTVRVSCECLIKKNSFLARYVKGSSAHG